MKQRQTDVNLHVLRLPRKSQEDHPQQKWVDRAEDDLLSAAIVWRKGQPYIPEMVVCYLLHQGTEKWLKCLLAIYGIPFPQSGREGHCLRLLLEKSAQVDSCFEVLLRNLDENIPVILDRNFPSNLRYEDYLTEMETCLAFLWLSTFRVRRVAKRKIKEKMRNEL